MKVQRNKCCNVLYYRNSSFLQNECCRQPLFIFKISCVFDISWIFILTRKKSEEKKGIFPRCAKVNGNCIYEKRSRSTLLCYNIPFCTLDSFHSFSFCFSFVDFPLSVHELVSRHIHIHANDFIACGFKCYTIFFRKA